MASLGPNELTHWGQDKMDAIFQKTFSNGFSWIKNVWISIKIWFKFVPRGPVSNIPALVQIMAWHRPSDNPLSESMGVSLMTYIGVNRPRQVKQIILPWCYETTSRNNVTKRFTGNLLFVHLSNIWFMKLASWVHMRTIIPFKEGCWVSDITWSNAELLFIGWTLRNKLKRNWYWKYCFQNVGTEATLWWYTASATNCEWVSKRAEQWDMVTR